MIELRDMCGLDEISSGSIQEDLCLDSDFSVDFFLKPLHGSKPAKSSLPMSFDCCSKSSCMCRWLGTEPYQMLRQRQRRLTH